MKGLIQMKAKRITAACMAVGIMSLCWSEQQV